MSFHFTSHSFIANSLFQHTPTISSGTTCNSNSCQNRWVILNSGSSVPPSSLAVRCETHCGWLPPVVTRVYRLPHQLFQSPCTVHSIGELILHIFFLLETSVYKGAILAKLHLPLRIPTPSFCYQPAFSFGFEQPLDVHLRHLMLHPGHQLSFNCIVR